MGIVAARMDRLVQFQRATLIDDGFGTVETWVDHGQPVNAAREDVKDSEKAMAGAVMATLSSRFLVRSSAFSRDITPIDRLIHQGRTFNITGVKEAAQFGRRQVIEISAVAIND